MNIVEDSVSIRKDDPSILTRLPRVKYDFVLPMGEACFVAQNLEKLNLRFFSSPLDWAGGRPFVELFDMFASSFDRFIEKDDMKFYTQLKRKNPHCDVYRNEHTLFFFPHDFPIGVPFDEAYPAICKKYERRITRLDASYRAAKRVLILNIELPQTLIPRLSEARLVEMAATVAAKYPETHTDLLYIAHNPDLARKTARYRRINDRLVYAEINNSNPKLKDSVEFNDTNIAVALRSISLNRSFHHRLSNIYKKISSKIGRNFYCIKYVQGEKYHRILGISIKAKS